MALVAVVHRYNVGGKLGPWERKDREVPDKLVNTPDERVRLAQLCQYVWHGNETEWDWRSEFNAEMREVTPEYTTFNLLPVPGRGGRFGYEIQVIAPQPAGPW